jgi:hypothetical protein
VRVAPNSKIGDFTVTTPLLPERIEGSIFLAQPHQNLFNSLVALYLVAKSSERGILVKVAGQVELDPRTGRLVANFDRLPQIPYARLDVFFREGQRAALSTPTPVHLHLPGPAHPLARLGGHAR